VWYNKGQLTHKCWYKEGGQDRDRDLAVEVVYENKKTIKEIWGKNCNRHRDGDLPAVIYYNNNGKIKRRKWYKDGELIKEENY
jgi:antitoxin component YwqK of YwqJK toxin-antitoxin module